MSELKLRYYDTRECKWEYIDLYENNTRLVFELYEKTPKTSRFYRFTGLKDKNGKEIYEGEIVKYFYEGVSGLIVEFKDGKYIFGRHNLNQIEIEEKAVEVIGNTYENPELLDANAVEGEQ